ncbi:hypothetical protein Hanom_Chr05g00432811 [Helianthus anomalus]
MGIPVSYHRQHLFKPFRWESKYPTTYSISLNAPLTYMTLYAAFFREGNLRLSMSKFLSEVLTKYGIHISQVNTLGCLG